MADAQPSIIGLKMKEETWWDYSKKDTYYSFVLNFVSLSCDYQSNLLPGKW